MIGSLVVSGGKAETWVDDVYLTGLVAWLLLTAITLFGYLVFAFKPDGKLAMERVEVFGLMGGLCWPLVLAIGALVGVVIGLRAVVHGQARKRLSRARRQAARREAARVRTVALEAENAQLDRELEALLDSREAPWRSHEDGS